MKHVVLTFLIALAFSAKAEAIEYMVLTSDNLNSFEIQTSQCQIKVLVLSYGYAYEYEAIVNTNIKLKIQENGTLTELVIPATEGRAKQYSHDKKLDRKDRNELCKRAVRDAWVSNFNLVSRIADVRRGTKFSDHWGNCNVFTMEIMADKGFIHSYGFRKEIVSCGAN